MERIVVTVFNIHGTANCEIGKCTLSAPKVQTDGNVHSPSILAL
jgi:hypothetical protein